jgi:hypothetical protein
MEIPAAFYYIVGTLIVANIASVLTVLTFIFKAGMFVADTKAGIKDAKDTGVRAHLRIDVIDKTKTTEQST